MDRITIRSQIGRKKRRLLIIAYSGMAFFLLGMLLSGKFESFPIFPFIGFAVFMASIGYAFWGIRCPRCAGNFGIVAMYWGSPFSVSKKIKFCPFCGIDIDTELKGQNKF
jgi:hypothetical protein